MKKDIKIYMNCSINYQRVLEISKEMMIERGYHIYDIDTENLTIYAYQSPRIKSKIYLYIVTTHDKLNIELIKYYYSILQMEDVKHAIIVYKSGITASVNKALQSIDICIELFPCKDLQYNLIRHTLVPQHVKIDTLRKNDAKYPVLKRTDPVARFLGFKSGDVVQINRKDGSIYYRIVR